MNQQRKFMVLFQRHMIGSIIQLSVKNGGEKSVFLEMTFVPPHPFMCNMPKRHSIKAESITDVYAKVVNFFRSYGIEYRD